MVFENVSLWIDKWMCVIVFLHTTGLENLGVKVYLTAKAIDGSSDTKSGHESIAGVTFCFLFWH